MPPSAIVPRECLGAQLAFREIVSGSSTLTRRAFVSACLCLASTARPVRATARSCLEPLFARYPELRARVPHVALGSFPTPVEPAEALGRELGAGELWVKRDDLSGSYGGGKTRKLETLLGEALSRGHRHVATFGGFGSNHCVATAHYAAKLGLATELYLLAERKSEHAKRNLGAMLRLARSVEVVGSVRDGERRLSRKERAAPYVVPAGGSSPLGTLPFVAAAFELADQVDAKLLPRPDVVVVAAGTMGTAAGLGLGLSALGWDTRVLAVRASSPGTSSELVLRRLVRGTRDLVGATAAASWVTPPRVRIEGRELGGGYAVPTARGRRMLELAEAAAGLSLELTYTAKALAAVERERRGLASSRVLFWHTASSRPLDSGLGGRAIPAAFAAYLS